MVTLIGLQRYLLNGLELVFFQCVHFAGEHDVRGRCRIDTAGFDGDDYVAHVLKEALGVVGDDTSLVWLGDISKDDIHRGDEHSVSVRNTGILDNG